jgi:hypothetical protein
MQVLTNETEVQAARVEAKVSWGLVKRIAFRFTFIYFVLFFLTGQEVGQIPFSQKLVTKYTEFWQHNVVWVAKYILHLRYDINVFTNGSGDTTYNWLLLLCYLVLATAGTLLWSILDRKRSGYDRLHQWFRLLIRFSLAFALILYGLAKVIPTQMSAPGPAALVGRLGDMSPMGLLWTFVGASTVYEIFTGCAELLGGILLLVPRTVLLGSLVSFADMTMVFTLNMCYNVPVKIMSFHYLLMAIILAAPDVRRLANLFIFDRRVEPAVTTPLFKRRWLNLAPQVIFLLFGLYSIVTMFHDGYKFYKQYNPPHTSISGAWAIDEFSLDGEVRPPLMTDTARWQRVMLSDPGSLSIQMMTGPSASYSEQGDMEGKTLSLEKYLREPNGRPIFDENGGFKKDPDFKATLSFDEPEPDMLILEGELEGHRIRAKAKRMSFNLTSKGFHWINEYPN